MDRPPATASPVEAAAAAAAAGSVRKPVGSGSLFVRFAEANDRLCDLFMPEEPAPSTLPLSADIKAKLLARQDGLRQRHQQQAQQQQPATAAAAQRQAAEGVVHVRGGRAVTDSAKALAALQSPDSDGEASSSSDDAASSASASSATGGGDARSSSNSRSGSAASAASGTSSGSGSSSRSSSPSSAAADAEDSIAAFGGVEFLRFDSDVSKSGVGDKSTGAADGVVSAGGQHLVRVPGPIVSGVPHTFDTRTVAVVDYTYPDGSQAPLAIPLWSVPRFERTGRLYCTSNAAIALHEEITDLFDWLRPTEAEVVVRRLVEVELSDIATQLWPGCTPCAYGSLSTHLMLPTSDVDMTILDVPVNTEDALLAMCKQIASKRLGATAWPQMILKTKVPLVKFATRLGGVEVDVSVNAGDGKVNSELVRELCMRFPESKVLIPIIKYFLAQREMNEPFTGTLGSFATTLLVLSFLQLHPIYTTHVHLRAQYGLGRLLIDFFRYYSTSFNYHRVGISLAQGGSCFLRSGAGEGSGPRGPAQVLIEDPGNNMNNVASSLRHFQNVRTAFDGAYAALTADPGVARLQSAVDTGLVNPQARSVVMRPTLLSRVIHSTMDVMRRREKADAGLAEFEASETPERVRQVKAHKRADDEPLLLLPTHEPMSDPRAAFAELAARAWVQADSPLASTYASSGSYRDNLNRPHHHHHTASHHQHHQGGGQFNTAGSQQQRSQQQHGGHHHHDGSQHHRQQHQHQAQQHSAQASRRGRDDDYQGQQRSRPQPLPPGMSSVAPPIPPPHRGGHHPQQQPQQQQQQQQHRSRNQQQQQQQQQGRQQQQRTTYRGASSSDDDDGFAWQRRF